MMHSKGFKKMAIHDLEQRMIARRWIHENAEDLVEESCKPFDVHLSREQVGKAYDQNVNGASIAILTAMFDLVHTVANDMNWTDADVFELYKVVHPIDTEEEEE